MSFNKISETYFRDQQVIPLARMLGWLVYFTWKSFHSPAGFPDLVLVKGKRLIFAELKTDDGKFSPAQLTWLAALEWVARDNQAIEVYVWRPSDLEHIKELLNG